MTRRIAVTADAAIDPRESAHLERQLGALGTLAQVLAWLDAQEPPRRVTEIVTQDEYTHDLVVAWRGDVHLVFDAT